jgi:uncharacterized membrane protein
MAADGGGSAEIWRRNWLKKAISARLSGEERSAAAEAAEASRLGAGGGGGGRGGAAGGGA